MKTRFSHTAPSLAEINFTEWRRSYGATVARRRIPSLAEINFTEWRTFVVSNMLPLMDHHSLKSTSPNGGALDTTVKAVQSAITR